MRTPIKRDSPWDYGRLEIIAASELVVCYMGACLPMIGACLGLVFPNRFGASRSGTRSSKRWTTRTQAEKNTVGRSKIKVTSTVSVRVSTSPANTLAGLELPMMRPKDEWDVHVSSSDTQPLTPAAAHVTYKKNGDTEEGVSAADAYERGR